MGNSLVTEQSNRLLGQIVDDLERLKEEFLKINIEEIIENNPNIESTILVVLDGIKSQNKGSFIFLESLRKMREDGTNGVAILELK